MTIACLGWGSLYWESKSLPLAEDWKLDGPVLPVEFLRHSSRGRVMLVLDPDGTQVPGIWAPLRCKTLAEAVEALMSREGTGDLGMDRWAGGASPQLIPDLQTWARERNVDAVVWTALGYRSKLCKERRTVEQIMSYFRSLSGDEARNAEEYVRRAPKSEHGFLHFPPELGQRGTVGAAVNPRARGTALSYLV